MLLLEDSKTTERKRPEKKGSLAAKPIHRQNPDPGTDFIPQSQSTTPPDV